ncbi:aldose 1-epimerase family protein [Chitinophaga silvatica]|uniref:Aldose 1-epimerase family protein n=1 Tax=Chitinophaga silvatica TaxID=2282649 RepID=A0A3E1YI60_9BACT|nr:aldose 1-epimerase family protein [Chitinophaga silvatica]RFS27027.1 aldose 1-epimerase family protein [Chitinophaga silvatica]
MIQLTNERLSVEIAKQGAELQSIRRTDWEIDYLWNGDPAFWSKRSPVLFPIVGGLKNNTYEYNGQNYTMGRHGFARDKEFKVIEQSVDKVTFELTDNEETLKVYPFRFVFNVTYQLERNKLIVTYNVRNTDDKVMLFSVGAHPAFRVPLVKDTTYEDYFLRFNKVETTGIWPLSPDGQIESAPVPFLNQVSELPLKKSLFYKDALVFKSLASTTISIKSKLTPHGLTVSYDGFPFMGIWAAKDADFVCIEPWCGIADSVTSSGKLEDKEGILSLEPGNTFTRSWNVELY